MKNHFYKVFILIAFSAFSVSAFADDEVPAATSKIGENRELNCTAENSGTDKSEQAQGPAVIGVPGSSDTAKGLGTKTE